MPDPYSSGLWVPCSDCEEFWCTLHECHAFECDCPSIEEMGEGEGQGPAETSHDLPASSGDG